MLGSLYNSIKNNIPLTCLGGADGFYRMVRWIQLDERSMNLHLLRSGDLVLSTEYADAEAEDLVKYITSLNELNASGLILCTDEEKNEETLCPEVKELCDTLQFPLFSVPKQIHIADITRETCAVLFDFDHAYDTINDILSGLLYGPQLSSKNEEYTIRFGFPMEAGYTLLAFQDDRKEFFLSPNDDNYKYLNKFFYTLGESLGEKFFYFREAGYGIILLRDTEDSKAREYADNIVKDLIGIHQGRGIRCGIGTKVTKITDIMLSFHHARAALSYARFKKLECVAFEDMGFYKMLFSSENQDSLAEYTRCLEPIISYDKKHNSELVKTLSVYLKSGKSIQKVAQELSCHRNTINYRMGRIEELLYLDINDYENAFILELAFRVLEYLQQLRLEDLHHDV